MAMVYFTHNNTGAQYLRDIFDMPLVYNRIRSWGQYVMGHNVSILHVTCHWSIYRIWYQVETGRRKLLQSCYSATLPIGQNHSQRRWKTFECSKRSSFHFSWKVLWGQLSVWAQFFDLLRSSKELLTGRLNHHQVFRVHLQNRALKIIQLWF